MSYLINDRGETLAPTPGRGIRAGDTFRMPFYAGIRTDEAWARVAAVALLSRDVSRILWETDDRATLHRLTYFCGAKNRADGVMPRLEFARARTRLVAEACLLRHGISLPAQREVELETAA